MNKVEEITKDFCKELREKLNPVIEKFCQETYGLKGVLLNAKFDNKSVTFQLQISAEGISDIVLQSAKLAGFPPIGTTFDYAGKQYEVVNYNFRKAKPIVVCDTANRTKQYVFTSEDVKRLAGIKVD